MSFAAPVRRVLAAASIALLTACSGGSCASCTAPPIYTAAPSPAPGATATPTPHLGATATPSPGATATPTPMPTATPAPTATPTAVTTLSCAVNNAPPNLGVNLGTAVNFAVLAATPVLSNTGATQIMTGDIGISPAASITGFPPGLLITGAQHAGDAVAATAQADAHTAFTNAFSRPATPLAVADLGGQTYAPGIYRATASQSLGITGTVTLNGTGFPNAVYIFQVPTALTTATNNSNVALVNVNPCNVFWLTGSSATLGTFTNFSGTIISQTAITVTTGVTIVGRALDTGAAVTLDTDTVTIPPGP